MAVFVHIGSLKGEKVSRLGGRRQVAAAPSSGVVTPCKRTCLTLAHGDVCIYAS